MCTTRADSLLPASVMAVPAAVLHVPLGFSRLVPPRDLSPLSSALMQSPRRKPFRIRTSVNRPDLRIPKDLHLTTPLFLHLPALAVIVGNKRLITPVESALTKYAPATPLQLCAFARFWREESALTKNRGEGAHAARPSFLCSTVLPLGHRQLQSPHSLPHSFPSQRGGGYKTDTSALRIRAALPGSPAEILSFPTDRGPRSTLRLCGARCSTFDIRQGVFRASLDI